MISVFAIFGTLQAMIFKQFGVGLAAAILIDATIVRAVLLPATMKLLGDRNWHLPKSRVAAALRARRLGREALRAEGDEVPGTRADRLAERLSAPARTRRARSPTCERSLR